MGLVPGSGKDEEKAGSIALPALFPWPHEPLLK
jgi:hypothetical protein